MNTLRFTLLAFTSTLFLAACSPEPAQPETPAKPQVSQRVFTEGAHYTVLTEAVTEPTLQHYLTEYFWLGCPHCQNFEPVLKGYLAKHPNVTLVRKHPALGERWALDASIFYALSQNGHEALVDELFALYRQTRIEKNALPDAQIINAFLSKHNIDPAQFNELQKSDTVSAAMEQANTEMLNNRIQGVPSLVVKGKYLVKGEQPEDIKSEDDYYELINYLLNKD